MQEKILAYLLIRWRGISGWFLIYLSSSLMLSTLGIIPCMDGVCTLNGVNHYWDVFQWCTYLWILIGMFVAGLKIIDN